MDPQSFDLAPGTVSGALAAARWNDRAVEPEPGRLAEAPLQAGDRSELAEQPDLADRHGSGCDGSVAERRGERERERQVEPRLVDRQPAGQVDVDVVAREPDPRFPSEDGDEQGDAVPVDAARRPARRPAGTRCNERLDLDEERPRSFERRRDDAARSRTVVPGQERAGRVGHLAEPAVAHLEDADLVGRSETVLRCAEQADGSEPLALERENG